MAGAARFVTMPDRRAAIRREADARLHAARRIRMLDILTGTTLWLAIGTVVAVVVRLG